MYIIGYIHICQKGKWKYSLQLILNGIINSGLYDNIKEIRCGILTETGTIIQDEIFNIPKIKIIYIGYSNEYERPTLLHMKESANTDDINTKYFYFHTKGLRWFDTPKEKFIIDWIKLLIYWNIEKWKDAILKLEQYDTYGCNYYIKDDSNPSHYSGNFFWVKNAYLKLLPDSIGNNYNDPEFWICKSNPNYYNAYSSGLEGMGHYINLFPEYIYKS